MVDRGTESGNVALRVRLEGSCLTGFFGWCVGVVNGKLDNCFFFFVLELLGNELSFLVEVLNEVLFRVGWHVRFVERLEHGH